MVYSKYNSMPTGSLNKEALIYTFSVLKLVLMLLLIL
jgi:hypothetical protein